MNGEGFKENSRWPLSPIAVRTLLAFMGLTVLSNNLHIVAIAPAGGDSTVPLSSPSDISDPTVLSHNERDHHEEDRGIREAIRQLIPNRVYSVDTAQNRFWIKKREEVIFEAVVSTGSEASWSDEDAKRLFCESPTGVRSAPRKLCSLLSDRVKRLFD